MADDLKDVGAPDSQRINLSQPHEVRYWMERLSVSHEQLEAAVEAVGNSARAVRQHLGK